MTVQTLSDRAVHVLMTADPAAKAAATATAAQAWRTGCPLGAAAPPARPARPATPVLLSPGAMPKRSTGPKGRVALMHALAHIELNAIDLAWDMVARFGSALPKAFIDDWVQVAEEEARHFLMLATRLEAFGAQYGDLPAHDGLWEAARLTMDDCAARLVLVPLTLEARGIDVTPQTAGRFRAAGDDETASVLDTIYRDEITHLAVGVRWFEHICAQEGSDPAARYREILAARFTGQLKGPFNLSARATAGMDERYLAPWLG